MLQICACAQGKYGKILTIILSGWNSWVPIVLFFQFFCMLKHICNSKAGKNVAPNSLFVGSPQSASTLCSGLDLFPSTSTHGLRCHGISPQVGVRVEVTDSGMCWERLRSGLGIPGLTSDPLMTQCAWVGGVWHACYGAPGWGSPRSLGQGREENRWASTCHPAEGHDPGHSPAIKKGTAVNGRMVQGQADHSAFEAGWWWRGCSL